MNNCTKAALLSPFLKYSSVVSVIAGDGRNCSHGTLFSLFYEHKEQPGASYLLHFRFFILQAQIHSRSEYHLTGYRHFSLIHYFTDGAASLH